MPTTLDLLMRIEHRLTVIEYRLTALERRKGKFDPKEFFTGLWGKGLLILLLVGAQMPLKDALLAVLR